MFYFTVCFIFLDQKLLDLIMLVHARQRVNYTQRRRSPRRMIRGWDDEDVIDAEEAGPARKEKSGVGRGLIGRHHNCPLHDRTDSRNFLSRPTSSGAIFFSASENSAVSSHTNQLCLNSLLIVLLWSINKTGNCSVKLVYLKNYV